MTIPKKHRALSYGALAPGARFPTEGERIEQARDARRRAEFRYYARLWDKVLGRKFP